MVGAERTIGPAALRLGLFENRLTGGLGWTYRSLEFSYAFTRRYSVSLPGVGAKTAHTWQIAGHF